MHIKELEEANASLRGLLESVKNENSALRAELLTAGLELKVRNDCVLPFPKSNPSMSSPTAQLGAGGNEGSPSISNTIPISPQISVGMDRMRSTTASSDTSQTSLSATWTSKLSLDPQKSSSQLTHRQQYPFLTSSRIPNGPSIGSETSRFGESYFSMAHSSGLPNLYSIDSHDAVGQLESDPNLTTIYGPHESDRHDSIASTNASSVASKLEWNSSSTFNPPESARYSPGIFLHQFCPAQNHAVNSFTQLNSGE